MELKPKKRFFVKSQKEVKVIDKQIVVGIEEKPTADIFFWIPRISAFVFIMFLSIFALDVISEYQGIHIVFPLFMHLLPNLILLVVLLIAWKFDLLESLAFFCFGLLYIVLVGFGRDWSWYVAILFPALLICLLFILNWYLRKRKENHIGY